MKKTIILDIDGVLIDWGSQLPFFCQKNGINPVKTLKHYTNPVHVNAAELFDVGDEDMAWELMDRYNLEHGRYMSAFPDAVEHLHVLANKYNLVALTKFGSTTEHYLARKFNLQSFFPNLIKELVTIDVTLSKVSYVVDMCDKYDVVAFVDDQLENIHAINQLVDHDMVRVHLNRYDERADVRSMGDLDEFITNELDV